MLFSLCPPVVPCPHLSEQLSREFPVLRATTNLGRGCRVCLHSCPHSWDTSREPHRALGKADGTALQRPAKHHSLSPSITAPQLWLQLCSMVLGFASGHGRVCWGQWVGCIWHEMSSSCARMVGMSICTQHHPRMAFWMQLLNQQSSDTGWRSLAAHLFSSARDWSSSVPPPSTTAQVMSMENGRTPTCCSGSSFGALAFFSAGLYRHFFLIFFLL